MLSPHFMTALGPPSPKLVFLGEVAPDHFRAQGSEDRLRGQAQPLREIEEGMGVEGEGLQDKRQAAGCSS